MITRSFVDENGFRVEVEEVSTPDAAGAATLEDLEALIGAEELDDLVETNLDFGFVRHHSRTGQDVSLSVSCSYTPG
jgi:hypothetical protein